MDSEKTEGFENADAGNATKNSRRVYLAHAKMTVIALSSKRISVFKRFRVGG